MRTLSLIILTLATSALSSKASSTVPFKASQITVEYGHGRKAIFTLRVSGPDHGPDIILPADGMRRYEIPKVVGIEFFFEDGRTSKVPEEGLAGIEIRDIQMTMIETGIKKGSWFLTSRIENSEEIPNRIANDWVVFVFESFEYKSRWLERNEKRNSIITKAEQE